MGQYLDALRPDVVLFEGYHPTYATLLVHEAHERGIAAVYWAIEDPCLFEYTLSLLREYDVVLTTTVECVPYYAKCGITAYVMTFACNPYYHHAGVATSAYPYDGALAASHYTQPSRQRGLRNILTPLLDSPWRIGVWGAHWDRPEGQAFLHPHEDVFHGYLGNTALPDLCASVPIILGVQCDDSSLTQTAMRPYEVLGCRGFHLTQWTPATDAIFRDGEHLAMSSSPEETVDKTRYYLDHPEERERIAAAGQSYVYAEHTYAHRVRDVLLPALGSF